MSTICDRIFECEDLADQYGPVANDAAQWAARCNELNDADTPIPNGKRVSVPVHELKKMLRMLEPKLQQMLSSPQPMTVTTASGAQTTVLGQVQSQGMPIPIDD